MNEPRIIKVLVAMIWPFLSNKIRNRVSFFYALVVITFTVLDYVSNVGYSILS